MEAGRKNRSLLKRSRYFVRGAFRRFYTPALLSSFWLAMAGVADSVFVGNGIGSSGLAAISLGAPIYLFYNILSYGFSIGGSIYFAGRLAEGREEEAAEDEEEPAEELEDEEESE